MCSPQISVRVGAGRTRLLACRTPFFVAASLVPMAPATNKRTASMADLTNYAERLPKFEKTGSYCQDEKNKNYHIQLQELISGCQSNPELVAIVYGKYAEAVKQLRTGGDWEMSKIFSPPPRNLLGLPTEYVLEFIAKHTDLTAKDLAALQRNDPKGGHKIFLQLVQLPGTLRVEGDMLCRGFLNRIARTRLGLAGKRCERIKAGGFFSDGQVFWADYGSYRGTFEEGRLVRVEHLATKDTVDIDSLELLVTTKHQMNDNYSDVAAMYQYQSQPGLKLCNLFSHTPPRGAWKIPHYTSVKQPAFVQFRDTEMQKYLQERQNFSGQATTNAIAEEVHAVEKEKKAVTMAKAKAAAGAALQKAKELRRAKSKATAK